MQVSSSGRSEKKRGRKKAGVEVFGDMLVVNKASKQPGSRSRDDATARPRYVVPPKRRKPAIRDSTTKSHGLINAGN